MVINWLLDEMIVPFVKQRHRTDCGIACLLMIFAFYQYPISYKQLSSMIKVDKKRGMSLTEMTEVMRYFGFEIMAVHGERGSFFSDYPLPCIALVRFQTGASHYVVVYERSREKVVIADPAAGVITLKPEEFLDGFKRKWFTARYYWTGILLFVKKSAEKENRILQK